MLTAGMCLFVTIGPLKRYRPDVELLQIVAPFVVFGHGIDVPLGMQEHPALAVCW